MSSTTFTPALLLVIVLISTVSALTNLDVKKALDYFNATVDSQSHFAQLRAYKQEFAYGKAQLEAAELKMSELQAAFLLNNQMTSDPDSSCPEKKVTESVVTITEGLHYHI